MHKSVYLKLAESNMLIDFNIPQFYALLRKNKAAIKLKHCTFNLFEFLFHTY